MYFLVKFLAFHVCHVFDFNRLLMKMSEDSTRKDGGQDGPLQLPLFYDPQGHSRSVNGRG